MSDAIEKQVTGGTVKFGGGVISFQVDNGPDYPCFRCDDKAVFDNISCYKDFVYEQRIFELTMENSVSEKFIQQLLNRK